MNFKRGHLLLFGALFISYLLSPLPAAAQQSRFDEGNRLLEESLYEEAITLYKAIEEDGYRSGALWLNMGIAYTQLDSLGMAKFYLLKAADQRETEQLARQALEYVNERFPRRSAVLPALPWDRFFQYLSAQFGITAIVVATLVLFNLAAALLIAAWFRIDLRKPFRIASLSLFGLSALLFLFSLIIYSQQNRYSAAILTDRQSEVYAEPAETATQITTAFEGFSLRIDFKRSETADGWYYIRLENGMFGWIRDEGVRIL
ncbi:MAG: SH3 domain-containing protein [Balneolaceae bacterium]|nr:MAG: SH3 domain-containing protein [Balneolaceae bacterium]